MKAFARLLLLLPVLLFVSCAGSAPPSGFLGADDAKLASDGSLPFDRSFEAPDAEFAKYDSVAVKPMNTERLEELGLSATSERNVGGQYQKDANELAEFATRAFAAEIEGSENFSVAASGGDASLVLETALVELIPGRPAAQIANFFFPFAGLLNRPAIAIEGRLVDAVSGETLFAFADRETSEVSLLDTRKFSYYNVQRREISRWAEQLGKILDGADNSTVKDPFFIQPVAW